MTKQQKIQEIKLVESAAFLLAALIATALRLPKISGDNSFHVAQFRGKPGKVFPALLRRIVCRER
jgi:hypothetical protein